MKHFLGFTFLLLIFIKVTSAQSVKLPSGTAMQPYFLTVDYNKTTVLLFPAAIKDADRGRQDVIVSRQSGVDNVLKVKAARKDFEPSSLHVFTVDGKLYSFDIAFGAGSGGTFDLSRLPPTVEKTTAPLPLVFPEMETVAPETQLRLCKVATVAPFFGKTERKHRLHLRLLSIHFDQDHLYFRYRVRNRSTLPYNIDFSRMYISDGRQVKRSTIQQKEVIPVVSTGSKVVQGNSSEDFVFVLKRFTIPQARKFQIEFFEKDGGRNIRMEVRNRYIFKARPIF